MKKFFSAGYRLMSIDTETFHIEESTESTSSRIDYMYRITHDGQFQHGEECVDVEKGDLFFLMYGYGDQPKKIIKITDPAYLAEMDKYEDYVAKARAKDAERKSRSIDSEEASLELCDSGEK